MENDNNTFHKQQQIKLQKRTTPPGQDMLLALEKKIIKDALNNNLPEWSISEKVYRHFGQGYVGFWKSKFLCNFFIMEVMPHRNKGTIALQKQIFFLWQQKPLRSPSPLRLTKLLNFFQLSNCTKCKNLSEFTWILSKDSSTVANSLYDYVAQLHQNTWAQYTRGQVLGISKSWYWAIKMYNRQRIQSLLDL